MAGDPTSPYRHWGAVEKGVSPSQDLWAAPPPPAEPPAPAGHSEGGRHLASVSRLPLDPEPPERSTLQVQTDWALVLELQGQVAQSLTEQLSLAARTGQPLDRDSERQLGRALIRAAVDALIDRQSQSGDQVLSAEEEEHLVAAIYNAQFGLGRLQPLMDLTDVENIEITGTGPVRLEFADGRYEWAAPVADTNDELIRMVRSFAAYLGQTARDFSTAHPQLRLSLPDMSRLSAVMETTPHPHVSIRRHRLVDVDLQTMERAGSVDHVLAEFLRAAVRARKNIVVAGDFGSGKTTMLRALANEIHPDEKVITIEQEYELGLHLLPQRHHLVVPMEAREGNAEGGAGAVTLTDLVLHSMGLNARRICVGEVRGAEFVAMITAMTAGDAGSLCTIHAEDAHRVFTRFEFCGQLASPPMSKEAVNLAVGDAVHFIVHLKLTRDAAGRRVRYVRQVLEVTGHGENGRPAVNEVFVPGPDGRAVVGTPVACLADLVAAGLDPTLLDRASGLDAAQ